MPLIRPPALRRLALAALVGALALAGCAKRQGVRRYDRTQLEESLKNPEDSGLLLLGSFPLLKVIDGDTLKVAGLDQTLRLLAVDTEETFKKEKERRAFEQGWERYLAEAEAKSRGPVKIPTPLGEDAKHFAADFFKGVRTVHLERDHPGEVRGRFNRFLTYVFADKGGERLNYNVECVRAGMSPYFTKYGYSHRFHDDFVAAQAEARAAQRGIWDPAKMHYTDYDARIAWWNARADYIAAFEAEAAGRDDYVVLTRFDAGDRLKALEGREVTILATIADIRYSKNGPIKVLLGRRMFSDFPVIFFDHDVFEQTGMRRHKGEHVRVRGVLTTWYNKYKKEDVLQIEVKLPGQVQLSPVVRPGSEPRPGEAGEELQEGDAEAEAPVAEPAPAPATEADDGAQAQSQAGAQTQSQTRDDDDHDDHEDRDDDAERDAEDGDAARTQARAAAPTRRPAAPA
ncbi:MAG: thermonuclease family protein [Nannocystaceae bacterium]